MATGKINGGALPVNEGGTGANNATTARANLDIPEPSNVTALWSSDSAINIGTGNYDIPLNDAPLGKYRYIFFHVYANSFAGSNRGLAFAPVSALTSVCYLPLMCAGTEGHIRLQLSGSTLTVLSQSYSQLLCSSVLGVK